MAVAKGHARAARHSDETVAAARVVEALTLSVGMVVSAFGAVSDEPIAIVGVPTALLGASLLLMSVTDRWHDQALAVSGWAGVAVWVVILPAAHAEAMLAPLSMIVLCLAIAVGPERLLGWISRDFVGRSRHSDRTGPATPAGWIEEIRG